MRAALLHGDLSARVRRLEPELVQLRRELHRRPELGFAESWTARFVAEHLRMLGLDVRTGVGGTGVVADVVGAGPGQTLLIRAELDGIPVTETTGVSYASQTPGVMHACGHDAHMAAALGAAKLLTELRSSLAGTVRFCFQPAEELLTGAEAMIADGVTEGVDAVVAAHVLSALPYGEVAAPVGEFLSGADFFQIHITGSAGHAGMPQSAVDPVFAAAQLITALQSVVARETSPGERLVIGIAAVNGGTAANVAVEAVTLAGNVRWFEQSVRERALKRIAEIADQVCGALRTHARLTVNGTAPVISNSGRESAIAARAVAATRRAELVELAPFTASDDFGCFLQHAPGVFLGVGARGPQPAPHHHPAFTLDERAIGLTTELLVRFACAT